MTHHLAALVVTVMFAAAPGADHSPQHVVDQGISIQFDASRAARAGDPVSFEFQIKDTASGTPISGARPAAWLALHGAGAPPRDCKRQAATYLSGDLFNRADVDLNSYFVLSLNDDNSISVVDPLFGFGGSQLLAMLLLESPGADWALAPDQTKLFVSMPATAKVAVADTRSWQIIRSVATGPNPRRVVALADRAWIADDQGITAIDARSFTATHVRLGPTRELAASDDGQFLFAASGRTLVVVDAHSTRVVSQIVVDGDPSLLAYSTAAKAIYAVDVRSGQLFVIDARTWKMTATLDVKPGVRQIRFTPDGRFGLLANPVQNIVQVLDAATNRVVQNADVSDGPDQISFTSTVAYVRRRASEIVTMIPLDQISAEGKAIGAADFPGGQHVLGNSSGGLADSIVSAPEGPAVLVANPADKMIYLYKEGMAAPSGGFSTGGRQPRATLVVDHGLREETRGRYSTTVPVKKPGLYDVVTFTDSPRVVACFGVTIAADERSAPKTITRVIAVDPPQHLSAGAAVKLHFALSDPTQHNLRRADDVRALAFEAPGVWQRRTDVKRLADGHYEFEFVPPEAGTYYVWIESQSLGLDRNNSQFSIYEAN